MKNHEYSIINLETNFLYRKELESSELQKFSHFWIVNSIINSLYSSNNTINNDILKYNYFEGSIFQIIRLQLNIILNHIDLIKLNQKENNSKSSTWNELGSCITTFIIELMEKWDCKLCELHYHHLNNCEVTFNNLISENNDQRFKIKEIEIINSFMKTKNEDLWNNEELFWEIENLHPFREFEFGIKSDSSEEQFYSTPVTLIYLNSILKPYVYIWSNIRWLFNNLVTHTFLNEDTNSKNSGFKKVELNIFILEMLFDNVEKSILLADDYMINIWSSLLKRCIETFIKIIPKYEQNLSSIKLDMNSNNVSNYFQCIKVLYDILRSTHKTNQFFVDKIGDLLNIDESNQIFVLDQELSKFNFSNNLNEKPIDLLLDVNIKNILNKFPLTLLYEYKKDSLSDFVKEKYTFDSNIGKKIYDLNLDLNLFYKELFIKNNKLTKKHQNTYIINKIGILDENNIKVLDLLVYLKDLVILEENLTKQLIRALCLDSKKRFPNIDVDPTEVNLSIKLFNNEFLENEVFELKKKIRSIFILEFEASNSKNYIKAQLPTFYSLKIRLNTNINLNAVQTYGIPNCILSNFFNSNTLEKYSLIFTFLLEVKRCSIFLNQAFQSLIYLDRIKQNIQLCKQKNKLNENFEYNKFCTNDCNVIINWIELLFQISQKIRFSIQFITDTYYNHFVTYIPTLWNEFISTLDSSKSIGFMLKAHEIYLNKFHTLVLAPNKKKNNLEIDQFFQSISINFVLILKLGRRLSILISKIEQLVNFLSNANDFFKKKKYIPCLMLRRKIQNIVKKLILAFEVLYSEFNEYKIQLINSLDIYNKNNSKSEVKHLFLQLKNA